MTLKRAVALAGLLSAVVVLCVGAVVWRLIGPLPAGLSSTVAPLPGRIAFEGDDGNIWSIDPDGTDRRAHSEDATVGERSYRFPTWSPDGSTLAFVELFAEDDGIESAIHLHPRAGGEPQRLPTDAPPIYLNWAPDGTGLAYLANRGGPLTLELLDLSTTETTTLGEGTPLYFSWHPDGQRLLAHIGLTTLAVVERNGAQSPLAVQGGLFQAPAWSRDGARLAYVSADEEGTFSLQSSDAEMEEVETLAQSGSIFSLGWSADSRRLAYSVMTERVPLGAYGPLWVYDVESGREQQLSAGPVVGFFWSPDGEKLAYLRPEVTAGTPPAQEIATRHQDEPHVLWLRWYLWDGERSYPLSRFAPSRPFANDYLQYFDQYAQSISLWSPASDALLYSGRDDAGREGTWVLPTAEGSEERWLAAGVLAAWSPDFAEK